MWAVCIGMEWIMLLVNQYNYCCYLEWWVLVVGDGCGYFPHRSSKLTRGTAWRH